MQRAKINFALRQGLLQFFHPGSGRVRVPQHDEFELLHPLKMFQARVRDGRSAKPQPFELFQPAELLDASIRDFRLVKCQSFQLAERGNLLQPGIADGHAVKVEVLQFAKSLEVLKLIIASKVLEAMSADEGGA